MSQIRASISIIMAIVKCSVFTSWHERRATTNGDTWSCRACSQGRDDTPDWPLPMPPWAASRLTGSDLNFARQAREPARPKQDESDDAASSLQIMNYFLRTCNNSQSAHDAINRLQVSLLG